MCYARDELGAERVDALLATRPGCAALLAELEAQPRIAAFLVSERRKPKPDEAFVREVLAILRAPLPKRLEP